MTNLPTSYFKYKSISEIENNRKDYIVSLPPYKSPQNFGHRSQGTEFWNIFVEGPVKLASFHCSSATFTPQYSGRIFVAMCVKEYSI